MLFLLRLIVLFLFLPTENTKILDVWFAKSEKRVACSCFFNTFSENKDIMNKRMRKEDSF